MAGQYTEYLRNKLNDLAFGSTSWTPPTQMYVALFTVLPSESSSGTEPSGGNYSRVQIDNDKTTWTTSSSGIVTNAISVQFPRASSTWGYVYGFGLFDSVSSGNLLAYGTFTTIKSVNGGTQALLPIGDMIIKIT